MSGFCFIIFKQESFLFTSFLRHQLTIKIMEMGNKCAILSYS
jgi:hypothetical protein